jgi:outer membrane protein assembly factor BamB
MDKPLFRGKPSRQGISKLLDTITIFVRGEEMKKKILAACVCLGLLVSLLALPALAAAPNINLSKPKGDPGTTLKVFGYNFGDAKLVRVLFDGKFMRKTVTDTGGNFSVQFQVPYHTPFGLHEVLAYRANNFSVQATSAFKVQTPGLTLDPTGGNTSTLVNFSGKNFGVNEAVEIKFDSTVVANVAAKYSGAFSGSFQVPGSATVGPHVVTATGSRTDLTLTAPFNVNYIATLLIDPDKGPPTSAVTVSGSNYPPNDAVQVFFDNILWFTAVCDGTGSFSRNETIPNWLFGPNTTSIGPVKAGDHTIRGEGGVAAQVTFVAHTSWPQWRMNARHSGTNLYENNLNQLNVTLLQEVWQFDPVDGLIYSSPVYVNINGTFMVFIVASGPAAIIGPNMNATLYALNAKTGAMIWTRDIGRGPAIPLVIQPDFFGLGTPAVDVDNNLVYIGGSDDFGVEGIAYCFQASNGTPVWTRDLAAPVLASPTLPGNGRVYFPTLASWNPGNPNFYTLNQFTGNIDAMAQVGNGFTTNLISSAAWDSFNSNFWIGAIDFINPVLNDGMYRLAGAAPVAAVREHYTPTGGIVGSPAISNGRVFFNSVGGWLHGMSTNIPYNVYFTQFMPLAFPAVSSPAVAPSSLPLLPGVPGVIYVGSGNWLGAFDIFGGFILDLYWPFAILSSPCAVTGWLDGLAVPGLVFMGDEGGRLFAMAANDIDDQLWMASTGAVPFGIVSSPTVADGWVFVGGSDGAVHAYTIPTP